MNRSYSLKRGYKMNKNGAVWKLLAELEVEKGVSEIAINSPKELFVEKQGRFHYLKASLTENDINDFVLDVADFNGMNLNDNSPILDGSLPDGSRINIVLSPYAAKSTSITIRKYSQELKSWSVDPDIFGLDRGWIHFLRALVVARKNVIISGGTGVGKTTFMSMLLGEIPHSERVVSIEDTKELKLSVPNYVSLLVGNDNLKAGTVVTVRDLVKSALRMRPDRIIIGEVRGQEIFDLLQAMNTGHDGSCSSIHANSPSECLSRMETLFQMAGYEMPIRAVRGQMASAIDFIIQLGRNRKKERIVTKIAEVSNMESEQILMSEIAASNGAGLLRTGIAPSCLSDLVAEGGLAPDFFA